MSVTNNTFSGHLGNDMFFESFTSTVNPPATTGTWSDTAFSVTSFRGDAKARLDLTYDNNTFESTNFNNLGAFYNNAEGTFKSRVNTATDPGPLHQCDPPPQRAASVRSNPVLHRSGHSRRSLGYLPLPRSWCKHVPRQRLHGGTRRRRLHPRRCTIRRHRRRQWRLLPRNDHRRTPVRLGTVLATHQTSKFGWHIVNVSTESAEVFVRADNLTSPKTWPCQSSSLTE